MKKIKKKIKYNKSKTYLLPLLSEVVQFDLKFFRFLKNTYIFDEEDNYKNCFFIKHDFSFKNPDFTHYEHKLTDNQYFVDLVDIEDNKVIYIFKFPEEYLNEYNYFKQGKYSKFGEDAKELILEFYTNLYNNNPNAVNLLIRIEQILSKDKELRKKIEKDLNVTINKEAELTDKINEQEETIKLNKI